MFHWTIRPPETSTNLYHVQSLPENIKPSTGVQTSQLIGKWLIDTQSLWLRDCKTVRWDFNWWKSEGYYAIFWLGAHLVHMEFLGLSNLIIDVCSMVFTPAHVSLGCVFRSFLSWWSFCAIRHCDIFNHGGLFILFSHPIPKISQDSTRRKNLFIV